MSIDELIDDGPADSIRVEVVDGSTVVHLVGEIDAALRQQASDSMGLALMHGLVSIGAGAHGVSATLEGSELVRVLGATVADVTDPAPTDR